MQFISENQEGTDDVSLLRLLACNDGDALSDLYDRYGRLVYSVAINFVSDQAVAEEIVQDVFTRVWQKASTYDAGIARVSTWLMNITRNRAIDELRRLKGRPEKTSIGWEDVSRSGVPFNSEPEDETELSWQKKMVKEALGTLSPHERQLLALAYFEGYSQSEIADLLGVPLGTIKTHIRLAMHKLRLVLYSEVGDDFGN
ncbi:MAG: RNA polymerase sigma factor [Omnitrophica WOR_2 bacterium]